MANRKIGIAQSKRSKIFKLKDVKTKTKNVFIFVSNYAFEVESVFHREFLL